MSSHPEAPRQTGEQRFTEREKTAYNLLISLADIHAFKVGFIRGPNAKEIFKKAQDLFERTLDRLKESFPGVREEVIRELMKNSQQVFGGTEVSTSIGAHWIGEHHGYTSLDRAKDLGLNQVEVELLALGVKVQKKLQKRRESTS